MDTPDESGAPPGRFAKRRESAICAPPLGSVRCLKIQLFLNIFLLVPADLSWDLTRDFVVDKRTLAM